MTKATQSVDYGALGKQRFDNFCRTIDRLISAQGDPIDLLVAAGNSGMALAAFVELMYEIRGLPSPPKLSVPLCRYLPGHRDDPAYCVDSSALLEIVDRQLSAISLVRNVLFVDDEISLGLTALGVLKLINQTLEQSNRPPLERYSIVAEDQGFELPQAHPEVRFVPYDYGLEGYNNVIFFFTPSEFEAPIAQALGGDSVFPFHCRTNVLLGVPVKEFNNGKPRFTEEYTDIARQKIPDFSQLQLRYRAFLKHEIKRCLGMTN